MKDIEKLFSDKLAHHEVVPPPGHWDALAETLQRKRRRQKAGYRWVAAVLLLIGAAVGFVRLGQPSAKSSLTQEVSEEKNITSESTTLPTESLARASADQSVMTHQIPVAVPNIRSVAPQTVEEIQPVVKERPIAVMPDIKEITQEPISSTPATAPRTLVVDASRYKKVKTDHLLPAASPAAVAPVTVIYQPNPSVLAKSNSLGQRIDKTLTFIGEHGIGFSELRSAKSNLMDKVFSKEKQAAD